MKIAIVNCYFGAFPNYFQLWLNSCKFNSDFDFIMFTDESVENYIIPENVHVIKNSWDELKTIIQSKFEFEVQIESPYKLTDFKAAYGYIFSKYLEKYDYWGYCDVDLIFGDLSKFVMPKLYQGYEKIYQLGHLTLLKNNKKLTELFMQNGAPFSYQEVFSNKQFYSFDEHAGLMSISKFNEILEYHAEDMADISCRISRLKASRQKNYQNQVFYYEDGHVLRAYIDDLGEVKTDEFAYIHLQKRKMVNHASSNMYYIFSNQFVDKTENGTPNINTIKKLSGFQSDWIENKEHKQYYISKLAEFFCSSFAEKRIWIIQKRAERTFKNNSD